MSTKNIIFNVSTKDFDYITICSLLSTIAASYRLFYVTSQNSYMVSRRIAPRSIATINIIFYCSIYEYNPIPHRCISIRLI